MVYEGKRLKEVSEILKYFPVDEIEKIPFDVFNYIHERKDPNHKFVYDTSKKIYEQNIDPETISLLLYICKEYIYTGEQNDFLNRLEQIDIAQDYVKNNPNEYKKQMFGDKKDKK